jgi:hypothetical protein
LAALPELHLLEAEESDLVHVVHANLAAARVAPGLLADSAAGVLAAINQAMACLCAGRSSEDVSPPVE